MLQTILTTLESELFASRLNMINKNYPNLKQERHIRDSMLELLNEESLDNSYKAFAEHPRDVNRRVDLSIVKANSNEHPYSVELKFQYTNDYKQFLNYDRFVRNDFERSFNNKDCDMFILIVSHWEKKDKLDFDQKWGMSPNHSLSRYLSLNDNWKKNVQNLFSGYKDVTRNDFTLTVNDPYTTHYHFHVMSRNR